MLNHTEMASCSKIATPMALKHKLAPMDNDPIDVTFIVVLWMLFNTFLSLSWTLLIKCVNILVHMKVVKRILRYLQST